MDLLLLVMKTAMFFVGIGLGYVAVTWPFFAYRLVCHENDNCDLGDQCGVRKTRLYMLGTVGVGWLAAAVIGLALQREISPVSWMYFGLPFSLGWAFAMFAIPLRLWHRLLPWRG